MSVGQTTVDLWKRSLPWRVAVFGAILSTGLALFSGGGINQSPVPPIPPVPPPVPPNPSQQCGPQGQLSLQAPIVVSPSGSVPSNVQSPSQQLPTQSGIPASVLSRFRQFVTQVDASNLEQRLGERCVRMHGALDELEASDYAYADCFLDGEKKLVTAQSCSSDFEASEARFARLRNAYEASLGDASAATVEELARARERMLPFDETRERWGLSDAAVAAGDRAIATIEASDQRIADLEALDQQDMSTADGLERLAAASNLTALDRSRLSPQSRPLLERAEQANSALAASDRRLEEVGTAMQGSPTVDASGRAELISALSALTDLDIARASSVQTSLIEQAKETASRFALEDLIAAVQGISLADSPPEEMERIRDLASAARTYGVEQALDTSANAAFALADQAINLLEQSDRRIRDLHDTIARIDAGGPSALGDDVIQTHDTLTEFDQERMSDEDIRAYTRLTEARQITLASREGALTRDVPIYVRSSEADELHSLALSVLERELRDRGFELVEALERAAVDMVLDLSEVIEKRVQFSGTSLDTAEVELSIAARWLVSGEAIPVPRVEGTAAGNDALSLAREAVAEAATLAASEIANLAER